MAKKRDTEKVCFVFWYRVRNALPQRRKKNGFNHGGEDNQHSTNQYSRQNSSSLDTHKALQIMKITVFGLRNRAKTEDLAKR